MLFVSKFGRIPGFCRTWADSTAAVEKWPKCLQFPHWASTGHRGCRKSGGVNGGLPVRNRSLDDIGRASSLRPKMPLETRCNCLRQGFSTRHWSGNLAERLCDFLSGRTRPRLLPVRWGQLNGRPVTGTVIPQLGNPRCQDAWQCRVGLMDLPATSRPSGLLGKFGYSQSPATWPRQGALRREWQALFKKCNAVLAK